MYQETIKKLIRLYDQEKEFFGGESEEEIKHTEKQLNVTLPNSYKWFLSNYGGGGLGFFLSSSKMLAGYREKYPSMPYGYVMIYWCDEFGYCLDTNRMVEGECPVVNWSPYEPGIFEHHSSFYELFLEMIEDMIDNDMWDD